MYLFETFLTRYVLIIPNVEPPGNRDCYFVPTHADAGTGSDGIGGYRSILLQEDERIGCAQVNSIKALINVERLT